MKSRDFAKHLRKQNIPAETLLWEALRSRRCGGYKFVRQVPIAGYVADFVCRRLRVVVELDGISHEVREEYDAMRTIELEKCGYAVMRLTNDDIYDDIDGSIEAIFQFLEAAQN
jgi:very-short-patch-repair endonuclease